MKIGFGFDAHVFVENKPLKLGGVLIDYPKGLRGHSDGDVVLHALSDAILGACAKGDIGMYFRDDDKTIEGIDSKQILSFALKSALESELRVHNIDIVLVADNPKLTRSYQQIRESISAQCNIPPTDVSVKSKTTEGTLVSKDAIACFAVVLMEEL
ncbi:MAG: 2-C-methyl-D-erythritol 2,4-cyclodiphosphate synthase [Bacteroidetes bacterium]|nr:2-C-methyl-D-erythritol 2,4-cyclodiphosphate synthase [Bacteroidota bacterium]